MHVGGPSGECNSNWWWRGGRGKLAVLSTALTLGLDKMEVLLDKHEYTNCVGLKTGTSERDGVPSTGENSFNGNSGPCDRQFRFESHEITKVTYQEYIECRVPAERGTEIDLVGPPTTELGCKFQNPPQVV